MLPLLPFGLHLLPLLAEIAAMWRECSPLSAVALQNLGKAAQETFPPALHGSDAWKWRAGGDLLVPLGHVVVRLRGID
jgi:hypothetical protein